MKSLKILICEILIVAISIEVQAQKVTARAGIYDFTDEAAREFYLLSPVVFAGCDFPLISRLAIGVSAGFGYHSFKYNSGRHHLYLVPVFISLLYELPVSDTKVVPYLGGGFGLCAKSDKNLSLEHAHHSFTYGYHVCGGLALKLNDKVSLSFDIRYNLLVPPAMEELNISGVITTVGVAIPVPESSQ
jgi:hypothetical protein